MKRHIPVLLSLLLLAGCSGENPAPSQTPPPTPTESPAPISTLELDLGDGRHTFWLELSRAGEPGDLTVNIYQKEGDPQPLQTFTEWSPDCQLTELKAEDVNFDGYMDFHFLTNTGTQGGTWSAYYVWDREQGEFIPDPYGLNELTDAWFMSERKEVGSRKNWGITYYQYEDGSLTLVGESYFPQGEGCSEAYNTRRITVDPAHTFWVELVDTEKYGTLLVNIYEGQTEREPFQTFMRSGRNGDLLQTFEAQYDCPFEKTYFFVEDVDFDGDMDFYFMTARGHFSVSYSSYYIWDGEKFIPDPYGLNKICYANFHPETGVVESIRINSIASHEIQLYRYIDGELTCLRRLDTWDPEGTSQRLAVHDWIGGEWVLTYETVIDITKWESGEEFDPEFSRWHDLDYHGSGGKENERL